MSAAAHAAGMMVAQAVQTHRDEVEALSKLLAWAADMHARGLTPEFKVRRAGRSVQVDLLVTKPIAGQLEIIAFGLGNASSLIEAGARAFEALRDDIERREAVL